MASLALTLRRWCSVLAAGGLLACAPIAENADPIDSTTSALTTTELHRLTASPASNFGQAVAISGDGSVVLVGDPNFTTMGGGRAWAFRAPTFAAESIATGAVSAQFGRAVAVSADGTIAWVGAPVTNRVERHRYTSSWALDGSAGPTPSVFGETPLAFGMAIATPRDGSFAVVGAQNSTLGGVARGAVYDLRCAPGCTADIIAVGPDDPMSGFGFAVAVSGDGSTVWVGARFEEDRGGVWGYVQGSVGNFFQQGHFLGGGESSQFGSSLALSGTGDVLLVGAPSDITRGGFTGTASVFRRTGTTWALEDVFSGTIDTARFGIAVALSDDGELAVVANNRNVVALFVHRASGWMPYGSVASSMPMNDFLPSLAISRDGRRVVLGTNSADRADVFELSRPGDACDSGDDCNSGFCVDGVCCVSACGGGTSDCQACSVAAGGSSDGDCTFLAFGVPCRESAGSCDVPEVCSGTAGSCPTDRVLTNGTACAAGPCGGGRSCDGASPLCPGDPAMAGTVCRAAIGACDVEEICDGVGNECPADVFVAAGTTCREWTGEVCDAPDVCTGGSAECLPRYLEGVVCRPPAGTCDVAEVCSGGGTTCPPDNILAAGVSCRSSSASCDPEEVCDGVAPVCPADERTCDAGGSDGGIVGADLPPSAASGCSCRVGRGPANVSGLLALALLFCLRRCVRRTA